MRYKRANCSVYLYYNTQRIVFKNITLSKKIAVIWKRERQKIQESSGSEHLMTKWYACSTMQQIYSIKLQCGGVRVAHAPSARNIMINNSPRELGLKAKGQRNIYFIFKENEQYIPGRARIPKLFKNAFNIFCGWKNGYQQKSLGYKTWAMLSSFAVNMVISAIFFNLIEKLYFALINCSNVFLQ